MRPLHTHSHPVRTRAAFTLVEMLVSTGLVVLIMLMFAQIYGTVVTTIQNQRSLGANDQGARVVSSVLRADLQSMTYRQAGSQFGGTQGIVPLTAGDEGIVDPDRQAGYFYFSENDPSLDWDDVLQFTISVGTGGRGDKFGTDPFTGKAKNLGLAKEPDLDDGIVDNYGKSRFAEVAYFLRNGNLYRRMLLLRDPPATIPETGEQPATSTGQSYYGAGNRNYSGINFLSDFDYSATRYYDAPTTSYLWFNGRKSLDNSQSIQNLPVALPWTRFGFFNYAQDAADHGMPLEYADYTDPNTFIGRYTQEETSNASFGWPGTQNTACDRSVTRSLLSGVGSVGAYANGGRIADDLLMTNVEAFDIELYDEKANSGAGDFVDIGGASPVAAVTFQSGLNANPLFGPKIANNNVFDTWHPAIRPLASMSGSGVAPYRPIKVDGTTLAVPITWTSGVSISVSSPTTTVLIPGLTSSLNTSYQSNSLIYRVVSIMNGSTESETGTTGTASPSFLPVPGNIVTERNYTTGDIITWQCIDNRVGLKALRITIRFRDIATDTPRQTTILHSFVE